MATVVDVEDAHGQLWRWNEDEVMKVKKVEGNTDFSILK